MAPNGSLEEGVRVEARYALQRRLGEGTFGEVWSALDTRFTGRRVAIKFLKPEFLDHDQVVLRFENEAEALGLLQHPNIVGVSDRGAWGDRRFIVVEFVEGASLEAWLEPFQAAGRSPDLAQVRAIFDQVCAGVAAAHAVRVPGPIVHRDLKPANVMLREQPDGEYIVKVLDFGIAQLGGQKHTRTGGTMGTPLYMAPEQALGQASSIGPWTDVFALGVILVEMLTGNAQPESDATWWGLVLQGETDVRPLLDGLCAGVPSPVRDLLERALRPKGRERHADAGELRQAFRRACAAGQPAPGPPAGSAPAVSGPPAARAATDVALRATEAQPPREVPAARTGLHKRRPIAGAAVVLASAAVAGGLVATSGWYREGPRATVVASAPRSAERTGGDGGRVPDPAARGAPRVPTVVEIPAVPDDTPPDARPAPPLGAAAPSPPRAGRRPRRDAAAAHPAHPAAPAPAEPPASADRSWRNLPIAPVFREGGSR